MTASKVRLDRLLVERGLVATRAKGQALIMAGEVLVDGEPATKPGTPVSPESDIGLVAPPPYVSRGGFKLAAALQTFAIKPDGTVCADVGACTGGFTDVLLQSGASRVYAIDVGYGQLDWKLRQDERVVIMERTNVRYLEAMPEPIELITIDVSFISLRLVLPVVAGWLTDGGQIVALVKPQFEAGRKYVRKGGIVRDPEVHRRVLSELLVWAEGQGLGVAGLIASPIQGASGNVEFLVWLRPGWPGKVGVGELVAKAVEA